MRTFFASLDGSHDPDAVALKYGQHFWDSRVSGLVDVKDFARSRFHVGLCAENARSGMEQLTKRAALVSDTLLISHGHGTAYRTLGVQPAVARRVELESSANVAKTLGFHCPNLDELGRWILDSRPLLEAGLAWYLPAYGLSPTGTSGGPEGFPGAGVERPRVVDYLVRDGRVVDGSGVDPVKNRLVRPVLRTELPFVEGVGLRDFSAITVEEFAAYKGFRDFLRQSYLDMDEATSADDTDRALAKLGLQIQDQVRSMRTEMAKVRRKRAVAASGAVVATIGATLTAVYGPEFASAVAIAGASGGAWGIVNAVADNSTRSLKDNKWYYVWVLARRAGLEVG